ncbi:MAG: glycosyl hydrolase family 28-related protein, partial [Bacillus sp. (in: firmicutes)]
MAEIAVYAINYGVKADGVTDDSQSLQNAIDATPLGGKLILPAGTIIVRTGLTRSGQIHLQGQGLENTQVHFDYIELAPQTLYRLIKFSSGSFGSKFTGIKFLSVKGRNDVLDTIAIEGDTTSSNKQISVEKCFFDGFSKAGFKITDSYNCSFRDTDFRRCGRYDANDPSKCGAGIIMSSVNWGINGTSGNLVENCYFNGAYGIVEGTVVEETGKIWNSVFIKCIFEYCEVGLYTTGGRNTIINPYFEGNYQKGAILTGHAFVTNPFIFDNGKNEIEYGDRFVEVLSDQIRVGGTNGTETLKADETGVSKLQTVLAETGFNPTQTQLDQWESGDYYDYLTYIQNNGKVYQSKTNAPTIAGITPPTHTTGIVSDGAIDWEYIGSYTNKTNGLRLLPPADNYGLPSLWAFKQAINSDETKNIILSLKGYSSYYNTPENVIVKDSAVTEIEYIARRSSSGSGRAVGKINLKAGYISNGSTENHEKPKTKLSIAHDSVNVQAPLVLTPITSSTALNNSLFIDSTDDVLKFKNSNGAVKIV